MIIKNGKVLCDSFKFHNIDILTEDAIIKALGKNLDGDNVIDASNLLVLPGFIDSHIHPAVCKLTFDLKGSDGIIMITDAEVGAGLPDGEFISAEGNKLIIKDRQTKLPDGTIAGGSSCLIDGIKNMVSVGVRLEDAVKTATINPAKSVGLDSEIGSIKEGKYADIVICDAELNIKYVIVNGKIVYKGEM